MSNDALLPRSAFSGPSTVRSESPAASVSSVSGVGAEKPVPYETRLDQRPRRTSPDTRGLTNVPNSLCQSRRALADIASHFATSTSSWTKTPGTVYV